MTSDATTGPEVTAFLHKPTATVSYVVADPETRRAVVIDPVLDLDGPSMRLSTGFADGILTFLENRGYALDWILDSHLHADHPTAMEHIRARTGARTGVGSGVTGPLAHFRALFALGDDVPADGSQYGHLFADGEAFAVGGLAGQVLHTPGHTPACVAYLVGDALFVGDTLYMPDLGTARCDFPGGDPVTLFRSIRERILTLPAGHRVFVGHDYPAGGRPHAWESTIGQQRGWNIHVGEGMTERRFAETRKARDANLSLPALYIPSIQINVRAGRLPAPEADGRVFLRLPVDAL